MSKQPFLPLFFGDFSASTAEWRGEEASLYLTLLGHQWAIGSLPADPEKLCRLVRWDRKLFNQCWPVVSTKFQPLGDGRLGNSRLEDHRERAKELAKKNADAGRKGAESRWRKDGERHSDGNGSAIFQPMPDANGATHSNPSHPIPIHKEEPKRRGASAPPFEPGDVQGLDAEAWKLYVEHRSAIKKPIKPHSARVAAEELAALGSRQIVEVRRCIAGGWQGLHPEKAAGPQPKPGVRIKSLEEVEAEERARAAG
jgi:uncharacterized protein YdaU (DUF1376 family)